MNMKGENIWDSVKDLIDSKIDKNILSKLDSLSGLDPNFKAKIGITMKYDKKKVPQGFDSKFLYSLKDPTLSPRVYCGQIVITGNQCVFELGNNLTRSKSNQFRKSILGSLNQIKSILKLNPVLEFSFNTRETNITKVQLPLIQSIFKDSCSKKREAAFPSKYGWNVYAQNTKNK